MHFACYAKTVLRQASAWNRFWRDFLEVWRVPSKPLRTFCFGRIPCGTFHTKATSKKSRPPSGNFRSNPTEFREVPPGAFQSGGWLEDCLICSTCHSKDSSSFPLCIVVLYVSLTLRFFPPFFSFFMFLFKCCYSCYYECLFYH